MKSITRFFEPQNNSCFIIAEVAQSHDGSLGQAHAFIDAVANTGVDAIKFQTHIASAESTTGEPFRVHFSKQDANRYEYWKRMEFSEEQWLELAKHANKRDLYFISSPFSIEAINLLERIGVPAWKVGSGESNNLLMLERMIVTNKPILLSSGMSTWNELEKTIKLLRKRQTTFALLQATSIYPTPPEKIGLNVLFEYQKRFNCPVGLSDHSGTIFPALASVSLGARFIEVHVTMSRYMFGPDITSSITIEELSQLVNGIRFLEIIFSNPVNKDYLAKNLTSMRSMFQKSVVPRKPIPKGAVLTADDLTLKKPMAGLPAEILQKLYGKRVIRDLKADEFFTLDDIENI